MKEFLLNNINVIISLVLLTLSITYNIILFFKAKAKAKTQKEIDEIVVETRDNIKTSINQFIVDAEKLKHFTGSERKAYVMTRALSIAQGYMSEQEIDDYIEAQVVLTDSVNKHN